MTGERISTINVDVRNMSTNMSASSGDQPINKMIKEIMNNSSGDNNNNYNFNYLLMYLLLPSTCLLN